MWSGLRFGVTTVKSICLIALLILSSCSFGQKNQASSSHQTAETEQSAPSPSRAIASSLTQEELETSFQAIINDPNPEQRMSDYIDRVVKIYFRAQSYLKEFDTKLKDAVATQRRTQQQSSVDMMREESYSKLVTSWLLMENATARVSYAFYRLLQMANERGNDSSEARARQDRAILVTRAFRQTLTKNGRGAGQLAVQGLFRELLETIRSYRLYRKSQDQQSDRGDSDALAPLLQRRVFSNASEIRLFYRENARLIQQAIRSAKKDVEITSEIERLAPDLRSHLESAMREGQSRSPQNVRDPVRPDPGGNGNLTGNTFARGVWSLTYDDGPSSRHTPTILQNLKNRNMKATFFWLAQETRKYPSIVRSAKDLGMDLANHSFSHANLPKLGSEALQYEIVESTRVHGETYGSDYRIKYFRCPYGACAGSHSEIRRMIASVGMIHVFWNVDSLDWQDKDPESVAQRVRDQMALKGGGIVLFHDIHPQSAEATRILMDEWQNKIRNNQMRLITIDQAVSELTSEGGMPGPGGQFR